MATPQNTLGAPAEGFSQTITFAGRPSDRAPQTSSAGAQMVRGGAAGGQAAGLLVPVGLPPMQENKTMALLGQLADAVAAPQIKRKRLENYVSGMQAAAAGVAVQEIAEEQPWYSKLFGEADAVEGARVYTQQAKASELAVQIEEAMPELRKQGAEQANAYFTGLVEKSMTGDAATDAYLMQSLSRTLPGVMKKHAREHLIYQQEQASAAESTMFHSGAKLLQTAVADMATGKIDKAEFEQKQGEFAQLLAPPLGRNIESWQKRTAGDLMLLAERGQFHALQGAIKAGVMEALPPDYQVKVENALQAGEVTARARDAETWAPAMARIGMAARNPQAGTTVGGLLKDIEVLNEQYKLRTGNRLPIYSAAKTEASLEQLANSIDREVERQARDAARRAAAAQAAGNSAQAVAGKQALLDTLWGSGQLALASDLGKTAGLTKADEETFWLGKARTVLGQAAPGQLNAEQQRTVMLLAQNAGYGRTPSALVSGGIRSRYAAAVSKGDSAGLVSLHADWKNIHAALPEAAEAYFGPDAHKRMLQFDQMYSGNPAMLPMAYEASFGTSSKIEPKRMSKAELAGYSKLVAKEISDRRPGLFSGTGLEPGQLEVLTGIVQPRAESFGNVADMKQATGYAVSGAMRDGLQMFGGFVWQDKPGADFARSLQAQVEDVSLVGADPNSPPEARATLDKDFNAAAKRLLQKQGHTGEPLRVLSSPEQGLVFMWQKDGQPRSGALGLRELAEAIKADQLARRPAKPGTVKTSDKGMGPKLTFTPAPDAKSIYGRN